MLDPVLASQYRKEKRCAGVSPLGANKIVRGLEYRMDPERMKEVSLLSCTSWLKRLGKNTVSLNGLKLFQERYRSGVS